jgi:spore coat protein U-like protein
MPRIDFRLLAALLAGWALVRADPAGACTVSATGVAFGAYDPMSPAPDDSAGDVTLVCHPSVHGPVVALGAGIAGLLSPRAMSSGAATLDYNLYTSAAYSLVWGDGVGGSATVTLSGGTVSAGQRTFTRTIYGRIPPGQQVPAGTYTDTIMVTVIF